MHWGMLFGVMTFAGAILLHWDILTIGAGETRKALVIPEHEEAHGPLEAAPAR